MYQALCTNAKLTQILYFCDLGRQKKTIKVGNRVEFIVLILRKLGSITIIILINNSPSKVT